MTLGERIKKVRRALDLTQNEFGRRIGIKPNSISLIESGNRNASEQVILSICREFNVNETWLRNGTGIMFIGYADGYNLGAAVARLVTGESADFKLRLVNALSTLKDEHWLLLEQKLKEIVGMRDAVPVFAPALDTEEQERTESSIEAEARAEAEAQTQQIYEQILAEKRAAAGMSSESSVPEVGDGTVKQA